MSVTRSKFNITHSPGEVKIAYSAPLTFSFLQSVSVRNFLSKTELLYTVINLNYHN